MQEENRYSEENEEKINEETLSETLEEGPQAEWKEPQKDAYGQDPHHQDDYAHHQAPSQVFGIVSLVTGIVALLLFCTCLNIPLAVVSIIFGILHLSNPSAKKGFAIAGLIISAVSIVLLLICVFAFVFSVDFKGGLERGLQEQWNEMLPNNNDDNYDDYDDYDDNYDDRNDFPGRYGGHHDETF